jgi:hypothetical protein
MKTKLSLLAIGVGLVTLVGVTGIFVMHHIREVAAQPPPAQAALVIDTSDSRPCDCEAVESAARAMLTSRRMTQGSKLWLFVTGDQATAEEPILVGAYPVPFTRRVIEGREATGRQLGEALDKIKVTCAQFKPSKRSPIFLAIKRAVEQLRAQGCDGRNECELRVQSDLAELSEPAVRNALTGSRPASSALPPPIDNTGINILFCGLAEVSGNATGRHDVRRVDLTEKIWRNLFTDPGKITFVPHCSRD